MSILDKLEKSLFFKLIYWIARFGIGLAFIASGIRKMPGVPFTSLSESNPVGAYFSQMESLEPYWYFIGIYQIMAGFLALWNRCAAFAGVLMLPVSVNIYLISISLQMRGTPWISFLMLLGNLYFMIWHREQYRSLFKKADMSNLRLK